MKKKTLKQSLKKAEKRIIKLEYELDQLTHQQTRHGDTLHGWFLVKYIN